jgi:hypothetical protein
MTTLLPKDINDQTIPALRLKTDAAHKITVSDTAAVNSTAFETDTQIISLYADVPVYIKFGVSDTVTATTADHYFPAGVYYDLSIGGGAAGQFSHVSVLRVSDNGTLYISEKN